jgi:hypothetical protein
MLTAHATSCSQPNQAIDVSSPVGAERCTSDHQPTRLMTFMHKTNDKTSRPASSCPTDPQYQADACRVKSDHHQSHSRLTVKIYANTNSGTRNFMSPHDDLERNMYKLVNNFLQMANAAFTTVVITSLKRHVMITLKKKIHVGLINSPFTYIAIDQI